METDVFSNYMFKPDWAGMWEKGIKSAWADDMVARHGSINRAWDNYADEYENGEIKFSNRADLIGKIIAPGPESVLDIGGGTGVFAVPLARSVKRVVVAEPSEGMLNVLKDKAGKEGLDNIVYVMKRWEDITCDEALGLNDGRPYDAVLASHSIYYIGDLHRSFLKMNDVSKGFVYLFTGCSGHMRDKAYEKLYLVLHKKPLPPYPDYSFLYMVIREVGIQPHIEMIEARVKRPIKDVQELVDRWKKYLDTDEFSKKQEDAIREYLSDKVKEEDGTFFHCYNYKNALIYWKIEQNGVEAGL